MSRIAILLAVLALAVPGTASAFGKQDRLITMSDGVKIATTYYVPDGVPPAGGRPAVMLFHGLGGSRTDPGTPLGMSLNSLAETQLVPQGYAALTFDARGHGHSEGLVSIDGPREIQDVRELCGWLAAQPGVNGQRIGAFGFSYGGGAIWRATAEGVPFAAIEPAITWTDLYSALLPQDLARSGVLLGFWQSIQARAAPGLDSIVNDAIARTRRAVHAFADQRSVRRLLRSRVPTFLMQGRRDFAFDLDHALTAYSRLKAPKRLHSPTSGTRPPRTRRERRRTSCPGAHGSTAPLPEGPPNGIDGQPPEVARNHGPSRTFHYGRCRRGKSSARLPGTRGDRDPLARWRGHGRGCARGPRPSGLRSCGSRWRARTAGRRSLPSSLR
jgi:ABC-2 type transport system ATP-binding protein